MDNKLRNYGLIMVSCIIVPQAQNMLDQALSPNFENETCSPRMAEEKEELNYSQTEVELSECEALAVDLLGCTLSYAITDSQTEFESRKCVAPTIGLYSYI